VMNISVQVSLQYPALHSFTLMPRSSITGSYSSPSSSVLRNLHTAFHSGCNNLHLHQQCIKFPVLLYPHQHLFL
jgi:hypothetical protein